MIIAKSSIKSTSVTSKKKNLYARRWRVARGLCYLTDSTTRVDRFWLGEQ